MTARPTIVVDPATNVLHIDAYSVTPVLQADGAVAGYRVDGPDIRGGWTCLYQTWAIEAAELFAKAAAALELES